MISFLLDTNAIVTLLRTRASRLSERVHSRNRSELATSSISVFELYFGAFKSARRDEYLSKLDSLGLEIVPFGSEDAKHAGDIRAALRTHGTPIGPYDLLIAGQARARNLTLITNNLREFQRVADLRVEDWTI